MEISLMVPSFRDTLRSLRNELNLSRDRRHAQRRRSKKAKAERPALSLEALETRQLLAAIMVDTEADTVDATDGKTSLREALETANGNNEADTITFTPGVNTIEFDNELYVEEKGSDKKTTIQGPVTLKSQGLERITTLVGVFAELSNVEITGSTEGAIDNFGNLVIRNASIHGNSNHRRKGGGVYSELGQLTILNSTISGNEAARGGGVYVASGEATIVNSTIGYNSVTNVGGGVFIADRATAAIHNSIILGNTITDGAVSSSNEISGTSSADSSHNVVGNAAAGGLQNGSNGNKLVDGSSNTVIEETLTETSPAVWVHALKDNSPAIDAGDVRRYLSGNYQDQKGMPRIDGSRIDIGSVESIDDQIHPIVISVDAGNFLRVSSTGPWDISGSLRSTTGSVDIVLATPHDALIGGVEFMLRIPHGVTIDTSKHTLTTSGPIFALSQGNPVVLMSGTAQNDETQKLVISLKDLIGDGFAIPEAYRETAQLADGQSFTPTRVTLFRSPTRQVRLHGHLSFDVLHGSGVMLDDGANEYVSIRRDRPTATIEFKDNKSYEIQPLERDSNGQRLPTTATVEELEGSRLVFDVDNATPRKDDSGNPIARAPYARFEETSGLAELQVTGEGKLVFGNGGYVGAEFNTGVTRFSRENDPTDLTLLLAQNNLPHAPRLVANYGRIEAVHLAGMTWRGGGNIGRDDTGLFVNAHLLGYTLEPPQGEPHINFGPDLSKARLEKDGLAAFEDDRFFSLEYGEIELWDRITPFMTVRYDPASDEFILHGEHTRIRQRVFGRLTRTQQPIWVDRMVIEHDDANPVRIRDYTLTEFSPRVKQLSLLHDTVEQWEFEFDKTVSFAQYDAAQQRFRVYGSATIPMKSATGTALPRATVSLGEKETTETSLHVTDSRENTLTYWIKEAPTDQFNVVGIGDGIKVTHPLSPVRSPSNFSLERDPTLTDRLETQVFDGAFRVALRGTGAPYGAGRVSGTQSGRASLLTFPWLDITSPISVEGVALSPRYPATSDQGASGTEQHSLQMRPSGDAWSLSGLGSLKVNEEFVPVTVVPGATYDGRNATGDFLVDLNFDFAGFELGEGTITFPTSTGGYVFKADKVVDLQVGDTTLQARISLPLVSSGDSLVVTDKATFTVAQDVVIQDLHFPANSLTVRYERAKDQSSKGSFAFEGTGFYRGDKQYEVRVGGIGGARLRLRNGSFELANFVPQPQHYNIAGILIPRDGLKSVNTKVDGSFVEEFRLYGSTTLNAGGTKIELILGKKEEVTDDDGNVQMDDNGQPVMEIVGGLIVDTNRSLDWKDWTVASLTGSIESAFTVSGVEISLSGTAMWSAETTDDRGKIVPETIELSGEATFNFETAGGATFKHKKKVTNADGTTTSTETGVVSEVKGVTATLESLKIQKGQITKLDANVSTAFTVFGIDIDVTKVGFRYERESQEFGIYGSVKISTPEAGGVRVLDGVEVSLGSQETPGLVIKNGTLESMSVSVSGDINLYGLTVSPDGLTLAYSRSTNLLRLTGGVRVKLTDNFIAAASFPGDGIEINTQTGEVEVRGISIEVEKATFGQFEVRHLRIGYLVEGSGATRKTTISAGGEVKLPGGFVAGAAFTIENKALTAVAIKVGKEDGGIPIGNTGVFLNTIEAGIENLNNLENFRLTGTITATIGPAVRVFGETRALATVTGTIDFTKDYLKLGAPVKSQITDVTTQGSFEIAEGLIGEGTGEVSVYFSGSKVVDVKANVTMLPGGLITGSLDFSLFKTTTQDGRIILNTDVRARLAVKIPDAVPKIGGDTIGSIEVHIRIRPDERREDSFFKVEGEILFVKGRVKLDLTGTVHWNVSCCWVFSKDGSFELPGIRDLDVLIPLSQGQLDGPEAGVSVARPELTLESTTANATGPGATITYTASTQLPDSTTIDLFVDTDDDGHDGQLIASGLPYAEGEQTFDWEDLAAYATVPYDPSQELHVYGLIYDGNNLPIYSDYSAAITPPNFNPLVSLPGEHTFGVNQPLVFSNHMENAITFSDPLTAHTPNAQVVATLDVASGTLTLDPQQAMPWTNANNPADIDGSGGTDVNDALNLISMLNNPTLQAADGQLPSQRSTVGNTPMYDVDGDGKITAADAVGLTGGLLEAELSPSVSVLDGVIIEGNGTTHLRLYGTADDINRVLDGLTYLPYENAFFGDRLDAVVNRYPEVYAVESAVASTSLTPRALTVGSIDGIELFPVGYEQGSGPANLLQELLIEGVSSRYIGSASVSIEGYDPQNDVLDLPLGDQLDMGIDASFDAETGKLYLSGSRPVEDYEQALAFTTFSSYGTGERVLRVHVGDERSNVANTGVAVHIIAVNQPPIVLTGQGATYVSGSATAISVLPSISVTDSDSSVLHQAVVSLDANSYHQGEDVLTYEAADGIIGQFNALTGQLVLSGQAGSDAWSAALLRVKYRNSQAIATPGIRRISVAVHDGSARNSIGEAHQRLLVVDGHTTLQSVTVGNLPFDTATEVNDDDGITLAPELTLTAGSDLIDSVERIEVAITDNYIAGSDFLTLDGILEGMDASFDIPNGVLTLTGDVPLDWYEYVLQGVGYSNRSLMHDGVAREITFTVLDGFTDTVSQSMTAQFEALPTVQAGMEVLVYSTAQTTQFLDANLTVMYAGDMLSGATVEFTWDYLSDQDRLLFTDQDGITGNFDDATGVLTLTGEATVEQYATALQSIEYTNTRVNPITSAKGLEVFVQDGDVFSDSVDLLLIVDTQQVAPTVGLSTTEVDFTEATNPVLIASDLTIDAHDDASEDGRGAVFLTGAAVFIDGYVPGEDVLTFEAFESEQDENGDTIVINGEFDAGQGILFLDGRATPEQYQTVLRSVQYENVSAAPSTHSRLLEVVVAQGAEFASAPLITVTVTSLNDPPTQLVAPPASATMLENVMYESLGLEGIDYVPPSEQQPHVVLTATAIPDESLGYIELSNGTDTGIAEVGGVYTLEEIRSAVFVPALNTAGTGTFDFTVAGWNPILGQPDPAHLTESITIEVAGVEGLGVNGTVYDFDHLADGSLAGQDGWIRVAGGGSMTVTSGVASASGDNQQMRPTDFGLSGDKITVTAQLTTRSGINGWQFGILHSEGTIAGSDFVFAIGDIGNEWRLRSAGFTEDKFVAGTGAAEITSTLQNFEVRFEIDLAAPSGSGSGQLFVNDVFVLEEASLGLTAASLDPANWTGIHLRHAGGAELDSLSFRSGREATPGGAFVAQTFRDLLGRNATQQELVDLDAEFAFSILDDEALRQNVVTVIQQSREYGELVVTDAYQRLLGRAPSQEELDSFFVANSLDGVNNLIISSPEYFTSRGGGSFGGFVRAAFADLVHRDPSAQELDEATARLQQGTSRADITSQIEFSEEATGLVADQLFAGLLRRAGGRFETVDTARAIQEVGVQAVLNGLVASNEYYVRYGTQANADSRSAEEIEAAEAELLRQWLEGTPTTGNSQVTTDFESVGKINTNGRAHGGGTLIATQYVVTAAHLVDGKDLDSLSFSVGLTSYGLDEVHVHPDFSWDFLGTDDGNDIAILKLNRPVVDVQPAALWAGELFTGDSLTLVGFGPHPGDDGFGTKRSGTTPVDGLTRNLVTWTYDGADEATTVPGDSGSPQFLAINGTDYIASLASGGTHQALSLGDFAYNTRVGAYASWITEVTSGAVEGLDAASFNSTTTGVITQGISFVAFDSHQSVELSGDDLLIQDLSTGGENNLLHISTTATEVVISDAHQRLTTLIDGSTGTNSHTITIPLSSFTGNIVVQSAGGDDVVNVTTPSRLVDIDAGSGINKLVVNGSDLLETEEFLVTESTTDAGNLEVSMPSATTDGGNTVQAAGISELELNTGDGNDVVRPNDFSGLSTPLDDFWVNLGGGDDLLDGINATTPIHANGGEGNDTLNGGSANDLLRGSFGNDDLAGGLGDDTYMFDADDFIGEDTITENAAEGSDTLDFSPTDFNSIGIDLRTTDAQQSVTTVGNLLLTLSEHIENVTGGSHGNAIIGDETANILRGGDGLDYIVGGGGPDKIYGGANTDTLQATAEAMISGDAGADLSEFSAGDITFPASLPPIFEIAGTVPGTEHDQLTITGDSRTVTLGGELQVNVSGFTPNVGDEFTIIDLQESSSVVNRTFTDAGQPLNDGDSFTANGSRFRINYAAGDGNDVSVTFLESVPGVSVQSSSVSATVTEAGSTETLEISLDAQPATDVVIDVSSSDETEVTVDADQLTFTSVNWDVRQTVTITGVNDDVVDGNQSSIITFSIDDTTSDTEYSSVADHTLQVVTIDDDVAGIPTVLAPTGRIADRSPVIQWDTVSDAVSYEVEVLQLREAGHTIVFSQTVTGLEIETPTDLEIGRYQTRIRATLSNGIQSEWTSQAFHVSLTSAITEMEFHAATPRPEVRWAAVPGATGYQVWINNRTMAQLTLVNQIVAGTTFLPDADLNFGIHDVWVRPIGADSYRATWSTKESFYVGPALNNPAINTLSRRPELSWQNVPGVGSIHVWIQQGNSVVVNQPGIIGNSFTPPALSTGEYRWWIRPSSPNGRLGAWSPAGTIVVGRTDVIEVRPTIDDTLPTVVWHEVEDASSYDVYVRNLDTGELAHRSVVSGLSELETPPLQSGRYRVWVKAHPAEGSAGTWSRAFDFSVSVEALADSANPVTPQLSSIDRRPQLEWTAQTNASDLYLSSGTEFRYLEGITGSSWTPDKSLVEDHWTWQVRARNELGSVGPWSERAAIDLNGRSQISTATVAADGRTTIVWTAVAGAVRYNLHISNLTTGDNQVIRDDTLVTTSWTATERLPAGLYRVWVRVIGTDRTSAWSRYVDFEVTE